MHCTEGSDTASPARKRCACSADWESLQVRVAQISVDLRVATPDFSVGAHRKGVRALAGRPRAHVS